MDVLEVMQRHELEQVVAVNDPSTGLLGFIVIHDTTRGPGIGGCRLWAYPDGNAALADAVALAQAMTRKCALAGLNAGGAKGVFIEHEGIRDRGAMMRALGRYVQSLNGRFYTSGDLGLGPQDIAIMRETSRFVAVPDEKLDLAGATALGVLSGMRVALAEAGLGAELKGQRVAIQGLGAMGGRVAAMLIDEGAQVWGADIDQARCDEAAALGVQIVAPEAIYGVEAEVFSPCAVGGVLDRVSIPKLAVKVVVGAANNQLGDPEADGMLMQAGIRYAPDFAVNSGAVVLSARELGFGRSPEMSVVIERIADSVHRIFEASNASGEPPGAVAERLAADALVRPKRIEHQWWPVQ